METRGVSKTEGELKPGKGVQVDDTKYEYGADLSTEGAPIIDKGEGKTISIRVFNFKMKKENLLAFPTDKQQIFDSHARQIATILWGDGLKPFEGAEPRVIIDTKKGEYKIFVPCEARAGVAFQEKPKNLSQELAKQHKRKLESKAN